ncbi:hypothetical protein EHS13_29940 [Paenibacillus psychroresistens]|uniref:Uncharacterized protein n=1 Tax=Paenibacillus psychroresistens TaxID=1778678 RepID=A0A6B8RUG3_9BACL|nr:hypothetical protein [Paenibacillus psychroresistens]QGQ98798.1 hypothetical protein EHS13_29940 [Paenibacillus psychroresistens]
MNKRIMLAILLILFATVIIYLLPSKASENEPVLKGIVIKEVEAKGEHYIKYVLGDTVYLEDMNTQISTPLSKATGKVNPRLLRMTGHAVTSYTNIFDTNLIDPVSLKNGIEHSIPYTYNSAMDKSFNYLETLVSDGWKIVGDYSDNTYIDYYIKKNNIVSRVIILEDSMKVFYGIKSELPDPMNYIKDFKGE